MENVPKKRVKIGKVNVTLIAVGNKIVVFNLVSGIYISSVMHIFHCVVD